MCCIQLAESTGCKNSPSAHHRTTLSGYIFATKPFIENPEKNLLNSNISSTGGHNMVNFGPLKAEIGWRVWGSPANLNGFRVLASLTPFTVYTIPPDANRLKVCIRDTTGCQMGFTTSCIVYTNINWLPNPFDDWS